MPFEMTGNEIPKLETVALRVSRAALLSAELDTCKDVAPRTAPGSIHHHRPGNSLVAKSIQNFRLPDKESERISFNLLLCKC